MPFPLLGLLPGILRTVASITGLAPVKEAAEAIASAQLTPEQQATLQEALLRHEQAMKALSVEELKSAVSESVAMVQSSDKYTSRARPTMLYVATGITAVLCVIVGIAVLKSTKIELGTVGAIVSLMTPLWGAGGYYIYARTREKLNGGASE